MSSAQRSDQRQTALPPILVVELGQRIGVSVCGSLLAQLGANVVAIERQDQLGKCVSAEQLGAGKIRWQPTANADGAPLSDLIKAADVVLVSSDLGDAHAASRQDQIVCDITAAGTTGPLACDPLSDTEVQALTGILHTNGQPNGMPVQCPVPIIEYLAGINAAAGVLAALRMGRKSGFGQTVEVALYDCGFSAMASLLARLLGPDAASDIGRIGNRHGLSSPWNVYRAIDGWVQICTGSDDQWQRLCGVMHRKDLAGNPDFNSSAARVANNAAVDAAVQAWVGEQTAAECIAALTQVRVPGGPIVRVDGFPREPNLEYRGMISRTENGAYIPGSPLRMSRTPGRIIPNQVGADVASIKAIAARTGAASSFTDHSAAMPLSGIRVLEIGHYTTAPAAARVLAGFGADVIKIEPPGGEAARGWPPIDRGQSTFYAVTNSGKRSVVLDLESSSGKSRLRRLLERADVLIENLKPGALAKRGFSAESIAEINPRMIYCAISGFGVDTRYPGRPAFDTVVQGMSGLMDLMRAPDGAPLKTGISVADVLGAAVGVVAVLAALEERDRSGRGQAIDLSMQDIMAWATQIAWNGAAFTPDSRVIQAADGEVLLAAGAEVDGLGATVNALPRVEAVRRLRGLGRRAVPVVRPAEMMSAEHTLARRLYFRLADERGEWPSLAIPVRLSRTPPRFDRPSPALGRDTEFILTELCA